MKKDDRGITIIHALVGIMIFTVISSIIFSSSMANLRSLKYQQTSQQAYLTVSSAAKLFVDGFNGDQIIRKVINNSGKSFNYSASYSENDTIKVSNPIYVIYQDIAGQIDPSKTNIQKTYYMSVAQPSGDAFEDVKVELYVKGYTTFANFSLDRDEGTNYFMCVEIPMEIGEEKTDVKDFEGGSYIITTTTVLYFDMENVEYSRGKYVPKN